MTTETRRAKYQMGNLVKLDMESEMDQSVQPVTTSSGLRGVLIETIEYIDSLPLIKPRWAALDVAILLLLFVR